ncbi:DNA-directed DNA polymerase, family B, exonuclease domain containing protein [uncultured Caudovirales phage]|uniref:DNA-directed DNA polymerase n=1 Tax=uncultured Caudovirales phage TaxID=2100421 RepID=A0A6J5L877_9CAUD|nr:DNA-directed DNA polymerase, family B, exonuclease domain containing protein [uncultured Caudovirales phage]
MSYVDALLDKQRDRIHVVERVGGERIYKEFPVTYQFYFDDPKGKFTTIFNTPVSRFTTNSGKEFQREKRSHTNAKLWESDINAVTRLLSTHYEHSEPPTLHTAFFDIETDFCKERGYAPTEDPFNPITAISVYLNWLDKLVTLAIPPKSCTAEQAAAIADKYTDCFMFADEGEMLDTFLALLDDADVVSGWNSEGYDIPYTVNRIIRVLGKDYTKKMCLWGQYPKSRIFERFGKESTTYDLIGRVHMDYMQLYRKYTYEERHSYSLDAIGEYELKEHKTQYEGTLDQLYNNDFDKFIEYNRQDVLLVDKLDKKLRFLDLANALAHECTVLMPATMGSVAMIEQAIINEAHRRGMIVPDRSREENTEDAAAGAYVAYPVKGLHDYIGAIDINSLYPSTIRALNMGAETIVGQLRQTATEQYIAGKIADGASRTAAWEGIFASLEYTAVMNKERGTDVTIDWEESQSSTTHSAAEIFDMIYDSNMPWMLSANGTIFTYDRQAVVPGLLARWYAERKVKQAHKKAIGELSDGIEISPEFLKEVSALLETT